MKRLSFVAAFAAAGVVLSTPGLAQGKTCCEYNGKRVADCKVYATNTSLRIDWSDGKSDSYQLISQRDSGIQKTYKYTRGGLWQYQLYPQGNISLTNARNGNRIFVPLRGCS